MSDMKIALEENGRRYRFIIPGTIILNRFTISYFLKKAYDAISHDDMMHLYRVLKSSKKIIDEPLIVVDSEDKHIEIEL